MQTKQGYTVLEDAVSTKDGWDGTILCGTRTGKKVHAGFPGSSVTHCGHWMKFNAAAYRIRIAQIDADGKVLCERCFGDPS